MQKWWQWCSSFSPFSTFLLLLLIHAFQFSFSLHCICFEVTKDLTSMQQVRKPSRSHVCICKNERIEFHRVKSAYNRWFKIYLWMDGSDCGMHDGNFPSWFLLLLCLQLTRRGHWECYCLLCKFACAKFVNANQWMEHGIEYICAQCIVSLLYDYIVEPEIIYSDGDA